MTNNLVTTFQGITIGDTICNPDVGTFTVAAINEDKDRMLLVNQNPTSLNRYVGAFALQKKPNGNGYYWGQGHYHGGDLQSATEYVLGIDDVKKKVYIIIRVHNRSIDQIGLVNSIDEAMEIMREDLLQKLCKYGYDVDDFESGYDRHTYWDVYEASAWLNADDGGEDYDWQIIKVEV